MGACGSDLGGLVIAVSGLFSSGVGGWLCCGTDTESVGSASWGVGCWGVGVGFRKFSGMVGGW